MNTVLLSLITSGLLAIGFIAAIPQKATKASVPLLAKTQSTCGKPDWTCGKPESTVCACNHRGVPINIDGASYLVDFTGSMQLECIDAGITRDGYFWKKHIPTSFDVIGTDPALGEVHVYLDGSRSPDVSYMESLTTTNGFPAQHDVYAYAEMTISSRPGKTYRSVTPFHMRASSISSFGTGSQESYSVMTNVDFEDPSAGTGGTGVTVMAAPITINP